MKLYLPSTFVHLFVCLSYVHTGERKFVIFNKQMDRQDHAITIKHPWSGGLEDQRTP